MLYFLSGGRFIFAAAKPTPVDLRNTPNPRLANLLVSAAGPCSNFLLASVGVALLVAIRSRVPRLVELAEAIQGGRFAPGALAPVTYLLWKFAVVNVALAVFNLIPIPPLDGSGVLVSVAGPALAQVYAKIAPFGFFILILLISTPILGTLFSPFYRLLVRLVFGV